MSAPTPSTPSGAPLPPDALEADYDHTFQYWRELVGVRFRLLALVPALAGIGVGALSDAAGGTRVAVGLLGLFATLGIALYDLRNSMLHDAAVHRLKAIERRRSALQVSTVAARGGLFTERPPTAGHRFVGVPIKHDVATAVIYGAALGGWAFLVVSGLVGGRIIVAVGAAVAIGGLATVLMVRFDGRDRNLRLPDDFDQEAR